MALVKFVGAVDGIISIKNHLKGAFGLSVILDPAMLFVEEIWHDVQKVSGYILGSASSQTLAVSPANNGLVDMCPNLWYSNSKAIFFFARNLWSMNFSWYFLEMHVSFVHCVVTLLHYYPLTEVQHEKSFLKKTSMSCIQ